MCAKGVSFLDSTVEEMAKVNVLPDKEFVKALVNGYGTFGELEKMFEALAKMEKDEGVTPDSSVAAVMIVHCGRLKNMEMVYRVFDYMKRKKLRPSQELFVDFLQACTISGRLKDSVQVFAMLKGWVRDFPFDEQFFFALFNTYEGQPVLNPSLEAGEGVTQGQQEQPRPVLISEETLKQVFESMVANQFQPTLAAYNALIHAYGLSGNLRRCWQVVDRMRQRNTALNQLTYRYLIHAQMHASLLPPSPQGVSASKEGRELTDEEKKKEKMEEEKLGKGAWEILKQMKKDRVALDTKIYNSLIKLCEKQRRPQDAHQLFMQMRKEEVTTNLTTLKNVIAACESEKDYFTEVEQLKLLVAQMTNTLPTKPNSSPTQQQRLQQSA